MSAQSVYQTLSKAHPDNHSVRAELARTYRAAGRMHAGIGDVGAAIASFRQAIALGEEMVRQHVDLPEYRGDLAWSYNNLGVLTHRNGDPAEGRRALRKAIDIWKPLVEQGPQPELQHGLASAHLNIGYWEMIEGRMREALDDTSRAVSLSEAAVGQSRLDARFRRTLAHSLGNLGQDYDLDGQPARGRQALEQALAVAEPLAAENPAVTIYQERIIDIQIDLGHLLLHIGQTREAKRAFDAAMERTKTLPDGPRTDISEAYLHCGLGKVYRQEGQAAAALNAFETAVKLGELRPAEKPFSTYELACALALCSAVLGDARSPLTAAQEAARRHHADRAVETLRKAIAEGWGNLAWTKRDTDLDSLRQRGDFKKLIEETRKGPKGARVSRPHDPSRRHCRSLVVPGASTCGKRRQPTIGLVWPTSSKCKH